MDEREGFLRLTDVEFITKGDTTATPEVGPTTEYLINKTGIELICQPGEAAIEAIRSSTTTTASRSGWR